MFYVNSAHENLESMGDVKPKIMDVLTRIDTCDRDYFDSLSEAQKKTISPYVLMLWMNGCKSPLQILLLNGIVNELIFELPPGHNDLLYKLLMTASDGEPKKYQWVKRKVKSKKYATCVSILRRKFQCSTREALQYMPSLDYDTLAEYACDLGEQDDTLKKIKKELA